MISSVVLSFIGLDQTYHVYINSIIYLDPNTLPIPLVKAFPTNPDAPLPNDPKAERVAIPVAHLFLASLSHWVYPYTLAMFNTSATPTIINQENLIVIRQEKANNAQRAGVPYNVHQNKRVSAELFIRLG